MMKIRRSVLLLLCVAASLAGAQAQNVAIKTNLLYGAGTLTPNLGVEFGLGRKTTLDLWGAYNPWNLKGSETNNKKLVHWLVQPEFRYWLRERFNGHFFGIHALGGQYNVGGHKIPLLFDKEFRYEGYAVGGGVSYGYLWNFAERWGVEFTVGVGAVYLNYDKYDCAKCGDKVGRFNKTYFGPTKAGISLVYRFGGRKKSVAPATPAYIPPVVPATVPEPQPEPQIQPEPIPVPEPQPTTAEKLAVNHNFLAPITEFDAANRKVSGGLFSGTPNATAGTNRRDIDDFINDNREESLTIYFKQGGRTIDLAYRDNRRSFDQLISAIEEIQRSDDSRVAKVVIAGFASPEGGTAVNDRLAKERAETASRFLTGNSQLSGNQVEIYNGQVDWYRLRQMVEASDMPYREQVLDIIDSTPVWDAQRNVGRLGQLMRLKGGEPYRYMLKNFFPDLRNAAYIRVYYENK